MRHAQAAALTTGAGTCASAVCKMAGPNRLPWPSPPPRPSVLLGPSVLAWLSVPDSGELISPYWADLVADGSAASAAGRARDPGGGPAGIAADCAEAAVADATAAEPAPAISRGATASPASRLRISARPRLVRSTAAARSRLARPRVAP